MTILIKYPKQTKEGNEDFFKRKNQDLINLDWAKWGGWFDTDGYFIAILNHKSRYKQNSTGLRLKDKQPVELFSKIFETSLRYIECKTITPEPYRKEYVAQTYRAEIYGEKATWFTKNVFPYLIKGEKKDYAAKLLDYRPKSKDFSDWSPEEVRNYLATAIEGDGFVRCSSRGGKSKSLDLEISSSDVQYLSDIKYLTNKKLGVISHLSERIIYKTQEGIKTKYGLYICCSRRNPNNLPFFQNLVKEGVMTLDRKKQKVQEFVNQ